MNANFPYHFVQEAYVKKLTILIQKKKGNAHNYSFDYGAIYKSNILNIQKLLMIKSNI